MPSLNLPVTQAVREMLFWNPTVCSEAQKINGELLRKQWGTRHLPEGKETEKAWATRHPSSSRGTERTTNPGPPADYADSFLVCLTSLRLSAACWPPNPPHAAQRKVRRN